MLNLWKRLCSIFWTTAVKGMSASTSATRGTGWAVLKSRFKSSACGARFIILFLIEASEFKFDLNFSNANTSRARLRWIFQCCPSATSLLRCFYVTLPCIQQYKFSRFLFRSLFLCSALFMFRQLITIHVRSHREQDLIT